VLASLINEQGRAILKNTEEAIVQHSYQVVYGDTDSVMFDSRETDPTMANAKAEELAGLISKRYRFLRLAVDFIFIKMLLVQKKKYAAFGWNPATGGSRIEKKKLDMVRRDWGELTKSMSEFVIQQFMALSSDRDSAIQTIIRELEVIASMTHNGGLAIQDRPSVSHPDGLKIHDLISVKALKMSLDQYHVGDQNPQVSVARAMVAHGEHVPQNATIPFIICKSDERELGKRARAPVEIREFSEADINWYLTNQLLHPLWRLCEPFGGMDMGMIGQALGLQTSTMTFEHSAYPPDEQRSETSSLFRLFELTYLCHNCGNLIIVRHYSNCFTCRLCEFEHPYKFVINQFTALLQHFARALKGREKNLRSSFV
jgi:DNA polymerase alpha subunit A